MAEHQFDEFIGDLAPGDEGWLPLDAAGYPSGPATLEPPEDLGAFACSVSVSDDGHLVSSTGAPLDPPLNSNVDRRVNEGVPDPISLTSINPTSAVIGSADFTLSVTGEGFTENSVIVFNGGDEPTTFVSDTELTTGVKPSLVSNAITVPVEVREGTFTSEPLDFEFTDPIGRSSEDRRRQSGR